MAMVSAAQSTMDKYCSCKKGMCWALKYLDEYGHKFVVTYFSIRRRQNYIFLEPPKCLQAHGVDFENFHQQKILLNCVKFFQEKILKGK